MRGILAATPALPVTFGITPAHAGNTDTVNNTVHYPGDHPRACGEYPFIQYMLM